MDHSERNLMWVAILVIIIVLIYAWHRHSQNSSGFTPTFGLGARGGHPRFGAGVARVG